jgi:Fe-S cluster assembly ATP-binding protein
MLEIKNLVVSSKDKPSILNGINLSVEQGEVHALVGSNGSGKSTLAATIAGDPEYHIDSGEIILNGQNINALTANARAQLGFFYAFQSPVEVEGVTLIDFLWESYKSMNKENALTSFKFRKHAKEIAIKIGLDNTFLERYLNVGFSGGEKKKCEVLQLLLLEPTIAILDETDSGLDISAVTNTAELIQDLQKKNNMSLIIITHLGKFADKFNIQKVHILEKGLIIKEGDMSLLKEIETHGYNK